MVKSSEVLEPIKIGASSFTGRCKGVSFEPVDYLVEEQKMIHSTVCQWSRWITHTFDKDTQIIT